MFETFCFVISAILGKDIFILMKDHFVAYGDLMQFFAMFLGFFLLIHKDFVGILYLLIASALSLGIMLTSKNIFVYISRNYDISFAAISRRPDTQNYDGFPSGHSTGSFIAAGFICKKYGFKIGIFACVLALLVAMSRVYADRHTVLQVICGSTLGFCLSYYIAKK